MVHSHAGHHHGPGGHGPFHSHAVQGDPSGRGHVRRLRLALVVTLIVLIAEVVGGIASNSLALLADAGHMLTDVAALALSLFVSWFSMRPETPRRTYGYVRLEILAAFVNGAALLVISAFIAWEAISRLREPQQVGGGLMLVIALVGLLANVISAFALHGASDSSLNVRGAYLHVLSDLLGSIGTVLAALIIRFTGWLPADPIVSILVTLLIVRGAWRLVRESVDVMLESTPAHISLGGVRAQLEAIPGVESVHDLHVWTVTSGMVAMSAHAVVRDCGIHQAVLERAHDVAAELGIQHITIQLESDETFERALHLHP
jgi:cobalt-zinc-cadmium efflux system protein